MDIQLFADPEKTEKPTPRRRKKAREEGQVATSRELNMAVSFIASAFAMRFLFQRLVLALEKTSFEFFTLNGYEQQLDSFGQNLLWQFTHVLLIVAMIFMVTILAAVFVGSLQTKFFFSFKPLRIDLKRINPVEGFKRMFSLRSLFELIKSIFKMVIVGYVGYSIVRKNWKTFALYSDMDLFEASKKLFVLLYEVMFQCGLALLALAFFDYFYQWWEFEKSLRMTRQELKEEYREVEGSPEIKRKQREIMIRLARGRMLQEVPKADVVVTNPTHIAVALKYDAEEMEAPIVLAKGLDELAQKIVEIARQNNIPIVRNPQVARQLYYSVEVGEQIPPTLYRAVAEILAYVYSLKT
ncbi:flagellar biosynthesis protein FlhB [Pseudothermotoga thermarum]|uniref:Flagellar biosynthetic protein FlhB n=1 Tax=Pseudothermotoga thermarum DSM 5069 TaxID=688269 RepID=F7YXY5_9THEM|nr:flagellar biosynthetic protein FlhB [Pseudothermotoga thermarum DSM 5069]